MTRRDDDAPFTRGDQICMRIVQTRGMHAAVAVQDCDALREQGVEFPDWLVGTPTLVHRGSMTKYTGTEAVMQLSALGGGGGGAPPPTGMPRRGPPQGSVDRVERGVEHRGVDRGVEREDTDASGRGGGGDGPVGDDGLPLRLDDGPGDVDEGDDGEFGNLLPNPPEEDAASGKRVTEDDVKRFADERRRADEARKAARPA